MLTNETQGNIAKMFSSILEKEYKCYQSKRDLNEHRKFDMMKCYKRISSKRGGKIDLYAVIDFLKANSVYCSLIETEFFIMFNDKGSKGWLDYNDFKRLIKAKENDNNHNYNNDNNDSSDDYVLLPYDLEMELAKALESEMNLIRDFRCYLDYFKKRNDFTVWDMFQCLCNKDDILLHNHIKDFMLNKGIRLPEMESNMLFNRFDIQREERITIDQLKVIFKETKPSMKDNEMNTTNKFKSTAFTDINKETHDQNQLQENKQENNQKEYDNKDYDMSLFKKDFIVYIRLLMDVEYEIEQLKIRLTFQADFNIYDCFNYFDKEHKGYLTDEDLYYGLCSFLDQPPTSEDIMLLMKRYDLNNKGSLNFADFFDLLTPYNKDNRDIIEARIPDDSSCSLNISYLTKYFISNLLKFIITSETQINIERQKLQYLPSIAFNYIYSHIDRKHNNHITHNELSAFLQLSNVIFLQKECDVLFIRLDRHRKGYITIEDFKYELQSPYKCLCSPSH